MMSLNPWIALLLSFLYVFTMLGIAEGVRRWKELGSDLSRKMIHIAVGMYSVIAVNIFDRWEWAVIPPAAFIIINFLDWKFGVLQAMTSSDRSNLGTVYFPLAFAIIIWLFWDRPALLVGSLMPLTWGDALAAVVGRRWGRHSYTIMNSTRTLEGSATLFFLRFISAGLVLILFGTGNWLGVAFVTAVGATLVEAISPWGLDNLTIPAVSALLMAWLSV